MNTAPEGARGMTRDQPTQPRASSPSSEHSSDRSGREELGLLVALLLALHFAGCAAAFDESPHVDLFDQVDVTHNASGRLTVLTGFFLEGSMADLAFVTAADSGSHQLHLSSFHDGTWQPHLATELGSGVCFVDIANIAGVERLVFYERGQLHWFDPAAVTFRPLAKITTKYNPSPEGRHYTGIGAATDTASIPRVDVTRDLNGDGLDDLVFPDIDGFWVSVQHRGGRFDQPIKLGPAEPFLEETPFSETRRYGEVGITSLTIPWYLSRVHSLDQDLDGRSDLAFWNGQGFDVFHQDQRGGFSSTPTPVAVEVPIDSDGSYSVLFNWKDKSAFALITGVGKTTRRTVLQTVRDIDGDGYSDLLTHSLAGRGFRQASRYEVHAGGPSSAGLDFSPRVSVAVQPHGRAAAGELAGYSSMWLEDFDGDGALEFMRSDVRMGVGAMVRALFRTSFSIDTELYSLEEGTSEGKPAHRTRTKLDIQRGGSDAGFFPSILLGDVNGDQRIDALFGKSRNQLQLFLGVDGPRFLAQDPLELEVRLPGEGGESWLADLNRDGKQDLLLVHPRSSESQRITILLAR